MPNISLPTGKVMYLSTFEFYFKLEDKDMDEFYQSCVADDLGIYEDNPFSYRRVQGKVEEIEQTPDIEEVEVNEQYE